MIVNGSLAANRAICAQKAGTVNSPTVNANTAASFAALVNQIAAFNPDHEYRVCVDFLHEQMGLIVDELEYKTGKAQRESEGRARAAYHEAGHVVANWAMGFRSFGPVYITDGGGGHAEGLHRDLEGAPRHVVARHVVVNLAGDAAEIVRFGSRGFCDGDDRDAAKATIEGEHPAFVNRRDGARSTRRRISRYERRLKQVAERTLRAYWPAVEALAAALLAHASMDAEQVAACVRPFLTA